MEKRHQNWIQCDTCKNCLNRDCPDSLMEAIHVLTKEWVVVYAFHVSLLPTFLPIIIFFVLFTVCTIWITAN
jgi:hypothetical protein